MVEQPNAPGKDGSADLEAPVPPEASGSNPDASGLADSEADPVAMDSAEVWTEADGADPQGLPMMAEAEASPTSPPLAASEEDNWAEADDWVEPIPPPATAAEPQAESGVLRQGTLYWGQVLRLWRRLLRGVRSRIPAAAKLSDAVLSGILIGIAVLLLILLNRGGASTPAASIPPTPPVAIAPNPLETLFSETEGDPIADLQTQLAEVSATYADGLVQSVQASFAQARLRINLSDGWYNLSEAQQEGLAADLRARSDGLGFTALELRSPDETLVARSPVIGDRMVILQRQPTPVVPQPERPRYRITVD